MNNDLSKFIGNRINNLLAVNRKKQKELAHFLSVTDNTISYYVGGSRTPNLSQLIKIAEFFNTSVDYLVGLTAAPTTDKDVQYICDYTGLSEYSVNVLHIQKSAKIEKLHKTINLLLETEWTSQLIGIAESIREVSVEDRKRICETWCFDFEEIERIIDTKLYDNKINAVYILSDYLNYKSPPCEKDKKLSITRSGKIFDFEPPGLVDMSLMKDEDFTVVEEVLQGEIIEKILLDKVVDTLKQLKKELNNNGNNMQA